VPAFDRPFDAGNEYDPPQRSVSTKPLDVELPIVKGDSEAVEAKFRGPINKLMRLVRNSIRRVVGRMGVEIDLEHCLKWFSQILPGF